MVDIEETDRHVRKKERKKERKSVWIHLVKIADFADQDNFIGFICYHKMPKKLGSLMRQ